MLVVLFFFACVSALAQPADATINVAWDSVTDAERQMAAPKVDPKAGVEAIFWRVHVLDEIKGQELQRSTFHYVRLKVFNESGKDSASTVEVPYGEEESVLYVSGRTVKPDGTVLELAKDAVHDRDVLRIGRLRRRVKALAMLGVVPGAIVEYRWRQIQHKPRFRYARLQFQREFPVQSVTYYVRPLSSDLVTLPRLSLWPFNCEPTPLKMNRLGFNETTVTNMAAFKEEPLMPGEATVRAWALLFYHDGKKREPDSYWKTVGKQKYNELKQSMRVTDQVKQAAAQALNGAKTTDKISPLVTWVRQNIRDLFSSQVTEAERAQVIKELMKDKRGPNEVLQSRIATPTEMNTLVAAMATHAQLEVRPALVADRNDVAFDQRLVDEYFLPHVDLAVKQGDTWKVIDATTRRLPFGMLSWREQGMPALLSDPKEPRFIECPLSSPEESHTVRSARFTLSEEGTLEGLVTEGYSGHAAAERRGDFINESPERQQEALKKDILRTFPSAQVSEMKVENVLDADKLLTITYKVAIPGYAEVTGKRIFFAPLYFQRGEKPVFEAAARQYDITFPYAWKETDEVSIDLPLGFELDNAAKPTGLELGTPGAYTISMMLKNARTLVTLREFTFGRSGAISFKKEGYGQLKRAFDEVHRRDTHILAVKRQ
ncbi:MAG: DUF3857 domain-containing protein [Bryobacterales bacterium]|nr:DUF3857 domain-containing protein [Bryobacterales bacterium]